jgi:predicted amidohydrolase YtcJ
MVDRVFTNCEVRPLSGADPASAVPVTNGRVGAVGDPDELSAASAETVDCRGGVLLPGFIDAHTHLEIVGRRAVEADLAGADGPDDCIDRLLAADSERRRWTGRAPSDRSRLRARTCTRCR